MAQHVINLRKVRCILIGDDMDAAHNGQVLKVVWDNGDENVFDHNSCSWFTDEGGGTNSEVAGLLKRFRENSVRMK